MGCPGHSGEGGYSQWVTEVASLGGSKGHNNQAVVAPEWGKEEQDVHHQPTGVVPMLAELGVRQMWDGRQDS
jgi:hypothetical protein